jgi:molybdopterin molybdotransferase
MRPGKPLMFGKIGEKPVLGLPGNPVSTLVCAIVFLRPAMAALEGDADPVLAPELARLGSDMPANDGRQDYVRARLAHGPDGVLTATPLPIQDSSMLSFLVAAGCLILRPAQAGPAAAGSNVPIIRLGVGAFGI